MPVGANSALRGDPSAKLAALQLGTPVPTLGGHQLVCGCVCVGLKIVLTDTQYWP